MLFLSFLYWLITQVPGGGTFIYRDALNGPDFSPDGGLYYKLGGEQAAGKYQFLSAPESGSFLRLSVQSFCTISAQDCSERAEVWERPQTHEEYETGSWYAFSLRFVDPIPQDDHRYVIAQWKRAIQPGSLKDFSPLLALRLNNGQLFATVESDVFETLPLVNQQSCPEQTVPVWLAHERQQIRTVVAQSGDIGSSQKINACSSQLQLRSYAPMPAPSTKWMRFVVYVRPEPKGYGEIVLFVDGKQIFAISGPIGHDEGGTYRYFKFGPYRQAGEGVWALDFRDFARSHRCLDIASSDICQKATH